VYIAAIAAKVRNWSAVPQSGTAGTLWATGWKATNGKDPAEFRANGRASHGKPDHNQEPDYLRWIDPESVQGHSGIQRCKSAEGTARKEATTATEDGEEQMQ
jgi:hypothetical protein